MRLSAITNRLLFSSPLTQVFRLLLLPLLWLSLAGGVPHDHDLHDLCSHNHSTSLEQQAADSVWPCADPVLFRNQDAQAFGDFYFLE